MKMIKIIFIFCLVAILPHKLHAAAGYNSKIGCCSQDYYLIIYRDTLRQKTQVTCQHSDEQTGMTHMASKCSTGYFILDPNANIDDSFTITKNYELIMQDTLVPHERFCTAPYLPAGANQTTDIALICFEGNSAEMSMFMLKGIAAFTSVFFLIATLYIYYLIPDLRETQDKVTCIALSCLMCFMFFLGLVQLVMPIMSDSISCVPIAYIIYFFTISYFSWLNLIMLNVWKNSVLLRWKIKEKTWYLLNHFYGWAVPIGLSVALYIVSDLLPGGLDAGFGRRSCWFSDRREQWLLMYLPVTIMLVLNVVLFVWSAWCIHSSGKDVSPDKKKALLYKFKLYLKLFILAGLIWIFEILSFFYSGRDFSYWIVIDLLNGLHGLLIFLILIVWRQRIRKELAGKRILCFKAPESWSQLKHNDERNLNEEEEVPDNTKYDLIVK